jgi:hypothetical protein
VQARREEEAVGIAAADLQGNSDQLLRRPLQQFARADRFSVTATGLENMQRTIAAVGSRSLDRTTVRQASFAALLASGAMALAIATPAHAGKTDRAHEAIAAAEAKVHTAETIGAGVEAPRATAEARAALATAKEDLAAGHKSSSIDGAIRASALADTAIGELQRSKEASVASARDGASVAQDQAAAAQHQAAEANARADAAQQAAASSAADAAAARNAAAQTAPAQVETTVTTQQTGSARRATHTQVTRRTAGHTAAPSGQVTTTTKVTQP